MWVPGKTLYFKIQVHQYRSCLNLDTNCYCYFLLFSIYKCRPYFGIYLHMLFLSFLLVELVPWVRVCAMSF